MNKETELYSWLLESHINQMVDKLNQLSDIQWPWQPSAPMPSAQMLATNVLEWMICDRQHIIEPDAQFHETIPPASAERTTTIERIQAELKEWVRLFPQIRFEDLDAPRRQFNRLDADHQDVRWLMLHTIENVSQKLGELTLIWLALGHAGTEPYQNELPGECYKRLRPHLD